jgi:serine/threonine-protein kinase HipA
MRFYEIVIFCYITGNNDMHLKNFSLILNGENWEISPAYDLLNVQLHLPEDKEESALTIGGKKKKLSKSDFINLGLKLGLNQKQVENTFKRFLKSEKKMLSLIPQSYLSKEHQEKYIKLLQNRLLIFQ